VRYIGMRYVINNAINSGWSNSGITYTHICLSVYVTQTLIRPRFPKHESRFFSHAHISFPIDEFNCQMLKRSINRKNLFDIAGGLLGMRLHIAGNVFWSSISSVSSTRISRRMSLKIVKVFCAFRKNIFWARKKNYNRVS